MEHQAEAADGLVSSITEVQAKSILAKRPSEDGIFRTLYNMNLYRGCAHACIYCDTRSECYGIVDISRISVKSNAIDLLRMELSRKRERGVVSTGSMNDPYMPLEETFQLTRQALLALLEYEFPVHVITKGALVLRDLDILSKMTADLGHALVTVTLTTVDDSVASWLEPGASPPSERLRAIHELSAGGVTVGVALMPIITGLNDSYQRLSDVICAARDSGARYVIPGCLTLRDSGRTHFLKCLEVHDPQVCAEVQRIYGSSYMPPRWYAEEVYTRVYELIGEAGLETSCPGWVKPVQASEQLNLF